MSLKAYNDACLRAELFGQPKPDKDEFLEKNKHLDVVEVHEQDVKSTETTAMLNESCATASGRFNELNSILGSTQSRLNRLKGVCGSLTNLLRFKLSDRDNLSYSSEPSYVGQPNCDTDFVPPKNAGTELGSLNTGLEKLDIETSSIPSTSVAVHPKTTTNETGDINSAIDDLKTLKRIEKTSVVSKESAKDMKHQVDKQIDKLDTLIAKADQAGSSMQHQSKQMRSFLR